jgi:HSP20 family molecular chaperone IbpA
VLGARERESRRGVRRHPGGAGEVDVKSKDPKSETVVRSVARWEISASWPFPSAAEIERRFEQHIRGRWGEAELPAMDVFIVGSEVWVEVDLPGVAEEEVEASVQCGVLLIEATRRSALPAEEARPARLERPRGKLRRSIPLPAQVEPAQLEYRLESGVLLVRVWPRKKG